MEDDLYPLTFKEIFMEKVWGGRNLERLGKKLPPGKRIGESWEIWLENVVRNGGYQGWTLEALAKELGVRLVGERIVIHPQRPFPLLLKFIDAQDILSVQVHPGDEYAREKDGEPWGKTEAWYVIHAEPGGALIHGFRKKVEREELRRLINEGRMEESLYELTVRPGDVIFLPAGTIHAVKKGLILFEIQQTSDLTYRIYDWNRLGLDGKPRPLHIDKALDVIHFGLWRDHKVKRIAIEEGGNKRNHLLACRYFALELWEIKEEMVEKEDRSTFHLYSLLEGRASIRYGANLRKRLEVGKGQTVLIPAYLGECVVRAAKGNDGGCQLLRAYVPDLWKDVVHPLLNRGIDKKDIIRLGGDVVGNDIAALFSAL